VEALSGALSRVIRGLGLEEGVSGWRAVREWPALVGPEIARRSRAVGFRDGVLHVEVEGSAWMQELGFLKRDLVRTIQQRLGSASVRDIRFVVPRGGVLK